EQELGIGFPPVGSPRECIQGRLRPHGMSRGWRKLEHHATGADTAIDRVGARSRSAVRGAVKSACSVQRQSLRWTLAIRTALEAIQNGFVPLGLVRGRLELEHRAKPAEIVRAAA